MKNNFFKNNQYKLNNIITQEQNNLEILKKELDFKLDVKLKLFGNQSPLKLKNYIENKSNSLLINKVIECANDDKINSLIIDRDFSLINLVKELKCSNKIYDNQTEFIYQLSNLLNNNNKETLFYFLDFINFLELSDLVLEESSLKDKLLESLDYEEVVVYFQCLYNIEYYNSDLISMYLVDKAKSHIFNILNKLSISNAILILKNFIVENTKNIYTLCFVMFEFLNKETDKKIMINKIVSCFIINLIEEFKIALYSNNIILENSNTLKELNTKDINNIIKIGCELYNEFKVLNLSLKNCKGLLYFFSLIELKHNFNKFLDTITLEKEFYAIYIKEDISNELENEIKQQTYESIGINEKIYLMINNSLGNFLCLLSYYLKNEIDNNKDEDLEIISNEHNMFLYFTKRLYNFFQLKYNEQNTLLTSLKFKSKFNRNKILFCLDILNYNLCLINSIYNELLDINFSENLYNNKLIMEDFPFYIKEINKLIEQHTQVIYKDIKKNCLDILIFSNINEDIKSNILKYVKFLLLDVSVNVKISSKTQDYIINYIFYSSFNIIENIAQIDKIAFLISIYEDILTKTDLSTEVYEDINSKIILFKKKRNLA